MDIKDDSIKVVEGLIEIENTTFRDKNDGLIALCFSIPRNKIRSRVFLCDINTQEVGKVAYIPESHKKYNLLPWCSEKSGEVFSYPSTENDISAMLPEGEDVMPYGYKSYAEFYEQLDRYIEEYGRTDGVLNVLGKKIIEYKKEVHRRNIKENWSVLRYVGESSSDSFGFTHGCYYYWPCSIENPLYEGVISNLDFTSYVAFAIEDPVISDDDVVIKGGKLAPVAISTVWELAEDPTGMAAKVLSGEMSNMGFHKRS